MLLVGIFRVYLHPMTGTTDSPGEPEPSMGAVSSSIETSFGFVELVLVLWRAENSLSLVCTSILSEAFIFVGTKQPLCQETTI